MKLNILYEDDDIIVCEKPVNVLSQSGRSFDEDMVNILKNYLYESKGIVNGYIGLVHRLDRAVAGVMVFAKTTKALSNLNKQVQDKNFKKAYFAVCENLNNKDIQVGTSKNVVNFLEKNARDNVSYIRQEKSKNAKRSELNYTVLEKSMDDSLVLVKVDLLTGRHHQIRVQMNGEGLALWGDTKYNKDFLKRHSDRKWVDLALFSYKIAFRHPTSNKNMEFEIKPKEKEPFLNFEYFKNMK